jgi:hypothetical protein
MAHADQLQPVRLTGRLAVVRIVGFQIRQPKRDGETDGQRRERLCAAIQGLELEVRSEMTGIQTRCETASVSAAFLLEAIENGQKGFDVRLAELSRTIIACEERTRELSRQLDFLAGLYVTASLFGDAPEPAENSHCRGNAARRGRSKA